MGGLWRHVHVKRSPLKVNASFAAMVKRLGLGERWQQCRLGFGTGSGPRNIRSVFAAGLVEGFQSFSSVHRRWPRSHVDRHAKSFGDLGTSGTSTGSIACVIGDARRTASGNCYSESDQFFGFVVEGGAAVGGFSDTTKGFHNVGCRFPHVPHALIHCVNKRYPIFNHDSWPFILSCHPMAMLSHPPFLLRDAKYATISARFIALLIPMKGILVPGTSICGLKRNFLSAAEVQII